MTEESIEKARNAENVTGGGPNGCGDAEEAASDPEQRDDPGSPAGLEPAAWKYTCNNCGVPTFTEHKEEGKMGCSARCGWVGVPDWEPLYTADQLVGVSEDDLQQLNISHSEILAQIRDMAMNIAEMMIEERCIGDERCSEETEEGKLCEKHMKLSLNTVKEVFDYE
jgi:hypothetical protein